MAVEKLEVIENLLKNKYMSILNKVKLIQVLSILFIGVVIIFIDNPLLFILGGFLSTFVPGLLYNNLIKE